MAGSLPNGIRTSDLKSRILNLAQTSVYQIKLVPPPGVVSYLSTLGFDFYLSAPNIELLCKDLDLPQSKLQTFDIYDNYAGVSEKMVQRRDHGTTFRTSFYVDRNYRVIDVFDGWIDYTTNQTDANLYKSEFATYRMQYPSQYRGQIYVTKFEKDAYGTAEQYTLIGAYPLSINAIPLGYNQSQIMELQVTFSFIRYVREKIRWRPESDDFFNNGVGDFARFNSRGFGTDGNTRPGTAN